jgi:5-methylcytosine-specific restriction endonuclease McrA
MGDEALKKEIEESMTPEAMLWDRYECPNCGSKFRVDQTGVYYSDDKTTLDF